ncbi:MAG: hypothetical protein WC994_04640 [Brumimicrobium sp.]
MKYFKLIFVLFLTIFISNNYGFGQKGNSLNLKNVLVVAQQDDISDRYSMEGAMIRLLNQYNIKTKAALNIIKEGGSPNILLSDSIQNSLKEEGIDTYLLISVRGFDNKFKVTENIQSMEVELNAGHLFPLYREGASNVTFSFIFYRDGEPIYHELIRVKNTGSKDNVIKKLLKKVQKNLDKKWL